MKRFRPQTDHHLNRFTRAAHRRLAPIGLAQVRRWRSRRGPTRPSLRPVPTTLRLIDRSRSRRAVLSIGQQSLTDRSNSRDKRSVGCDARALSPTTRAAPTDRGKVLSRSVSRVDRSVSVCVADRWGSAPPISQARWPIGQGVLADRSKHNQSVDTVGGSSSRSVRACDRSARSYNRSVRPAQHLTDRYATAAATPSSHLHRSERRGDRSVGSSHGSGRVAPIGRCARRAHRATAHL